jgi:hypothetical protein
MQMPPPLPRLLLTLALGFAAAWLVACGGSGKGLLAGTSADELKSQLDTISGEVQAGQCTPAKADAHDLGAKVNALPGSVDRKLRAALSDGAKQLLDLAAGECRAPKTTVSTESTQSSDTTPTTPSTTTSTPSTNSTPTTTSTPSTTTTPTTPKPTPTPTTPTTPNNGGAGQNGGGANGGGASPGKGK